MRPVTIFAVFTLSFWLVGEIAAQPGKEGPRDQVQGERQTDTSEQPGFERRGHEHQEQGQRGHRGQFQRGKMDLAQMFKRFDQNHDGILLPDELPFSMRQRFERMDTNGDGRFDQAEQMALIKRFRQMRNRGRDQHGSAGNKAHPRMHGEHREHGFDQLLARMDKNGDGQITKDELPERIQARFDKLDTNGDGKFDKAEQQAAIERMRGRENKRADGDKRGQGDEQSGKGQKPKRPDGG